MVDYEVLPAVLDPRAARAAESLRVAADAPHLRRTRRELAAAPHRLQGQWSVGGQEQFYLEGQVSHCAPREDGCLQLWCSTQHPTEMQHVVAHCLNKAANQVLVEMRRMGGGFGGKESQSALFACVAALAANKLNRPVKLRLDRDDDMMITGKRHDFCYDYEVGFDDAGRILAVRVEMIARAGFSADLSGPVATRALCHFDNAYFSPMRTSAPCARAPTPSRTRRFAASAVRRARSPSNTFSTPSRGGSASMRWTCARPISTAERPQPHPYGQRSPTT